jgi:phosphoribosylaminoimidazole-succinocarboxamide synthase
MNEREKIYEGKAKVLFTTEKSDEVIQYFKDDATAFNAQKKGQIVDKGIVNNKISAVLFSYLGENGIQTHFIELLSDREMLVKRVDIVLVEVTIRNIAAGGLSKSLGIPEGTELKAPILEYHYKSDALNDPLINRYHIAELGIATDKEMDIIDKLSFKANGLLQAFFSERGLILVDFKLEFGRYKDTILLADEISPDTCRLWDKETRTKLDKDRFRQDLGDVEQAYQKVYQLVTS